MEGCSLVAPGLQQHLLLQCVGVLRAADLLTSFVVKNLPVDVSKKATGLFRCYASSSSHFNLVIIFVKRRVRCVLQKALPSHRLSRHFLITLCRSAAAFTLKVSRFL